MARFDARNDPKGETRHMLPVNPHTGERYGQYFAFDTVKKALYAWKMKPNTKGVLRVERNAAGNAIEDEPHYIDFDIIDKRTGSVLYSVRQ